MESSHARPVPGHRPVRTARTARRHRRQQSAGTSPILRVAPALGATLLHPVPVDVGDLDGHGHYGVLDDDGESLLCHECGSRFIHLGLHAWRGHGITAAEYRQRHGLSRRRGLVAGDVLETIRQNAQRTFADKTKFVDSRDPAAATAARLAQGFHLSPEGLAASRPKRGRGRKGTVVVCQGCGVEFCPLAGARRRRFCTRSCSNRANRATKN